MEFDNHSIKTSSDFRRSAREQLKGKWGNAVLLCLLYSIMISVVCGIIALIPFIGPIILILLVGPITLGFVTCFLKIVRNEPFMFENLFDGFNNFSSAVLAQLLITIFVFLWTLLLIIPGIIASYSYFLVFYILSDNPDLSAMDALKMSKKMMKGHKWKLFCLQLSFIGWGILGILSLYIGYLWLTPYMYASFANFYEDLKTNNLNENPTEYFVTV
ncbi:DUF975 family protein [Clostridium estertheticum]|uniref:DUF975 family protein n=1 Tax=Clostridium estertheticum TaxID=238834 RepID=A0AA47EKI0_9CLOT|nr:DUF975 family protein [Clostridium estertheticum]MBU3157258.1 DUF975 family protein [Clostridium estertheticum]MBU3200912.1 DUF975 family protein [Clostridium estertheticum]WAG61892.1 DUF975 family protein [Clostridium estertheticum]WAG63989.1 DUF975 family protein [Clostridium estertheticum]